ncbi:hypothetical protein [uncultured Flavobacterium sp.]|uniref:hypothetical protein n=1 Tax=uncultured Flavobacterium sp. TaxID=165435 RepID=UPI0025CC92C2|nr:hypothetical protein [uncultured Flavobacterium sp.]
MIRKLKSELALNLKHLRGWKTKRKIVVISVDDYGNVRLDSKKARENMDREGSKVASRFDAYDALENTTDLQMLFDALSSVKDKNGNHAVFTPFTMSRNINFEAMAADDYREYISELLPETYEKLEAMDPAYKGTWSLWKEGMDKNLMEPQFHGREHLNLKVFREKLEKKDPWVLLSLKNRSYTSIPDTGYATINFPAAFEFWDFNENESFREIIVGGLDDFEEVYGRRATYFNPPGGREHHVIHEYLHEGGIKYMDTGLVKNEHQGHGKYKRVYSYTGNKNRFGQTFNVRNVVFEPADGKSIDWVGYTLKQVEAAFRWNKPAVISTHRVNFCGHIDPAIRAKGINDLKALLQKIVQKWPDVEFMGAGQLLDIISKSK